MVMALSRRARASFGARVELVREWVAMFCWRAARVADLLVGSMMNLLEVMSTVPAVMVRLASLALAAKVAVPEELVKVAPGDQDWGPDWVKVAVLVMEVVTERLPPLVKVPLLVKVLKRNWSPGPPVMEPPGRVMALDWKMLVAGSEM